MNRLNMRESCDYSIYVDKGITQRVKTPMS